MIIDNKNTKGLFFMPLLLVAVIIIVAVIISRCKSNSNFEISFEEVSNIHKRSITDRESSLGQKTVLYLDHSTCVIDAVNNSKVWKAVFPNFTEYSDELVLIKGSDIDKWERVVLDRKDNKIGTALARIKVDIPWAGIQQAIKEIVNGNNQAIIVSDFEGFDGGAGSILTKSMDDRPWLSFELKTWLQKGFSIYIITEPYKEIYNGELVDKKRFYFIFTDDKLEAPISSNVKSEISRLINDNTCQFFKLTNSDISVTSPKKDMTVDDLDLSVDYGKGFELISIENDWDDIREYVMKLDEYGESLPGEDKQPLIKNIRINNGFNYKVEDIKIVATNITDDIIKKNKIISGNDISSAFEVDRKALKNNVINIYLTEKIFDNDFINDTYEGNLIKIDFLINSVNIQPYDEKIFQWLSLYRNDTAICVSKSIDNAIRDIDVIPSNPKRRVIHTVFLKTASFNK